MGHLIIQLAISVTDLVQEDTEMFWLNFDDIYWKTTLRKVFWISIYARNKGGKT